MNIASSSHLGRTLLSLYSGAGIGDYGYLRGGLKPVVLAEVEADRAAIARRNHTEADVLCTDVAGSIDDILVRTKAALTRLGSRELFAISATPPCQGMSKNGIGSLLRAQSDGKRPTVDPRNALYKPALELVRELRPTWFIFENVCRMMNTYEVDGSGSKELLTTIMERTLRELGYVGEFRQVEMADFGLPQRRLRTLGLFRRRIPGLTTDSLFPRPTHSANPTLFELPWATLRQAIGHAPPLDARDRETAVSDWHPLHRVPVWREELYRWMQHTPEGGSAFNNVDCAECRTQNGAVDVVCQNCGATLPRPQRTQGGKTRLIRGFPSAYKRMFWDKPASTVTTRSAYACSDHKVHPTQNRVLSTYEVVTVAGIPVDDFEWGHYLDKPKTVGGLSDAVVRDIVGECLPPVAAQKIAEHIVNLEAELLQAA